MNLKDYIRSIPDYEKIFFNIINSINGLKITFKEHFFIAEIVEGLILTIFMSR